MRERKRESEREKERVKERVSEREREQKNSSSCTYPETYFTEGMKTGQGFWPQ